MNDLIVLGKSIHDELAKLHAAIAEIRERTAAPPSATVGVEGGLSHSLRPATAEEQAEAWQAVCALLSEVRPGWAIGPGTGLALALDAIRALAQQPAADPYRVFYERAMDTAHEAMEYVQTHAEQFGACPGDDKLAIVCREFLKAQHPAAVDEAMVEAVRHRVGCHDGLDITPAQVRSVLKHWRIESLAAQQGGDT